MADRIARPTCMTWITCAGQAWRELAGGSGSIVTMSAAGDGSPPSDGIVAVRRELDDAVLVARARNGDPRAFEALVRRHQNAMFGVALRILAQRDDAEDVTQNAFITAWRRLPEFRSESKFSTWMYRIVSNLALNAARDRNRRAAPVDDLEAAADPRWLQRSAGDDDPEQRAQHLALLTAARAALDRLPEELRLCWLLREMERCSYQEVADITKVSLDTARGRIYRARLQLAEAMSPWR